MRRNQDLRLTPLPDAVRDGLLSLIRNGISDAGDLGRAQQAVDVLKEHSKDLGENRRVVDSLIREAVPELIAARKRIYGS